MVVGPTSVGGGLCCSCCSQTNMMQMTVCVFLPNNVLPCFLFRILSHGNLNCRPLLSMLGPAWQSELWRGLMSLCLLPSMFASFNDRL